jgi:flagellar basal body-associated protein FliL
MKTLILILVFIATFALVHALYVLLVLVRGEKRAASRRNRRRVL